VFDPAEVRLLAGAMTDVIDSAIAKSGALMIIET